MKRPHRERPAPHIPTAILDPGHSNLGNLGAAMLAAAKEKEGK